MNKTMGALIGELRREKGMTQLELAQQMGVTDKAVSKWERDLACPDVGSLPKLAGLLGISTDQLLQGSTESKKQSAESLPDLILRAVALAMGIAVIVTNLLGGLTVHSAISMLGLGLTVLAVYALRQKSER